MSENSEYIKAWFPKDLQELLEFRDEGNFVTMKGREFLPKEKFNKVYTIEMEHGGKYVSSGKLSHFRFEKGEKPSHQSRDIQLKDALEYAESLKTQAEHLIEKLKEAMK